jgi:succinoglycan biosynthesis transport protein ExoP
LSPVNQSIEASSGHSLADYGKMVRRRWIYFATILPGIILTAVLVAYILPPLYRANAMVMLQGSSIPKEMVSATTKDVDDAFGTAQQDLELVRRKIMDPEELVPLVKAQDPYPDRHDLTTEAKAQMMMAGTTFERVDPITGKAADASAAYAIHYENPNPVLAKKVARQIVDLFLTYNKRTRVEQSTAAYEFLASQAKGLETEMMQMEAKLAVFRSKFGGALPDMQAHNLQRIDGLQHDLENTQQLLLTAEDKESQLQLQLNTLSPSLASSVSDWKTTMAKTQADLIDAEQKYTPEHPEVKRLRRALADLRNQGTSSLKVGVGAPDNPDYLAVKSQLDTATREVTGLRTQESREREDMAQYEKNMNTMPNVQREYTGLQRDYENAQQRYTDLQGKMKNAALAQKMESESKGETFVLLHNASVPDTPYFPNRLGIILLGIILGGGLAFGAAAMVDAADPSVRGAGDLNSLLGSAAIGMVPRMLNPSDRRRRKFAWASAFLGYGVATALVVFVVIVGQK